MKLKEMATTFTTASLALALMVPVASNVAFAEEVEEGTTEGTEVV
ncbi:hypothetical protein [Allofustis seminis]|nr:hypothetical protein [Allofustis seminis]